MDRTGPIVLSVLLLAGGGEGVALAQDPLSLRLVRDLRLQPGPTHPEIPPNVFEFRTLGSIVVFQGWDGVHGWELWRSDGTAEGTALLADICPGHCSSFPFELRDALGAVYFSASDPDHGIELWRTDGTTEGTELVADIVPGVRSSSPRALTEFQGELFLQAWHPQAGRELWATDGMAGGLRLVADIRPGTGGSDPLSLFPVGSTLYFSADDGATGREPWKTDGTSRGTVPMADLCPGGESSVWYDQPGPWGQRVFGSVGDRLVLTASEGLSCTDGLLVSDGTTAGTERVPGLASSFLFQGNSPDGAILFAEGDVDGELWRTDGTVAGTHMLADIHPTSGSHPKLVGVSASAVYFAASDGVHGHELWRTDGTPEGTMLVRDVRPGSGSGIVLNFVPDGRQVGDEGFFFIADDGVHGRELWVTDGTEPGTQMTRDVNPGAADSFKDLYSLVFPAALDEAILRMSFDDTRGWALWRSDGTPAGTEVVRDLDVLASSAPPLVFGDTVIGWRNPKATTGRGVVWRAADDVHGVEPWVSDGTPSGTRMLSDTCGEGCEQVQVVVGLHPVTAVGDVVFLRSSDGDYPEDLWVTDGTPAGTRLVAEDLSIRVVEPWPRSGGETHALLAGDGLWVSDGTPEGTILLSGGWVNHPTPLGDTVLFDLTAGDSGQLWSTDGTPEGTTLVDDFQGIAGLAALDSDTLFFWADDGSTGLEPWISDGLPAGAVPLADVNPGPAGSVFTPGLVQPIAMDGIVFFPADDGAAGLELWATDGTPGGTNSLGDLNPGALGSDPRPLVAWDGFLFFTAFDADHGRELWRTNGTSAGTRRVADLRPGPTSGMVDALPAYHLLLQELAPVVWNDRLYFAATDGATGVELWSTDGTEGGTTRVADIHPGPGSSSPNGFATYGEQLFFTATDGVRGYELWALGDPPSPVLFADGFESGDTSAWGEVVP